MAFNQNLVQSAERVVTLYFNEESITLQPAEYAGKSLTQLYTDFGPRLGTDVARVESYIVDNVARDGSTIIRDGETVRAVAKSDVKGFLA